VGPKRMFESSAVSIVPSADYETGYCNQRCPLPEDSRLARAHVQSRFFHPWIAMHPVNGHGMGRFAFGSPKFGLLALQAATICGSTCGSGLVALGR
jgi:hypothetical protein